MSRHRKRKDQSMVFFEQDQPKILLPGSSSNNSPTKRALIVNLQFREPTLNTYSDGAKIKSLLINRGFKDENIDYWQDRNDGGPGFLIDADKIRNRLHDLITISKPGDTLFFHFSGHGNYQQRGRSYLVAANGTPLHGYEFKKVLDQMADGVKIIFMIDACYGGGFIELAHHKVVLFTSSKRDEESVRGSFGSVFTNAFVDCVNDYTGITHDELIQRIQILYGQHGSKPLPNLYATDEIKNSIFIL